MVASDAHTRFQVDELGATCNLNSRFWQRVVPTQEYEELDGGRAMNPRVWWRSAPTHGFEGEVLGVLFFGVCGLVVLGVPLLDRGKWTRRVLNVLTAVAVVFFIVMTAWGFFDTPRPQLILGLSLSVGMLVLLVPFVERGGSVHRSLYTAGAILLALVAALIVWELLCRWGVTA